MLHDFSLTLNCERILSIFFLIYSDFVKQGSSKLHPSTLRTSVHAIWTNGRSPELHFSPYWIMELFWLEKTFKFTKSNLRPPQALNHVLEFYFPGQPVSMSDHFFRKEISNLNIPWCNFRSFPLVLSADTGEKRSTPTSLQPALEELQRALLMFKNWIFRKTWRSSKVKKVTRGRFYTQYRWSLWHFLHRTETAIWLKL